MFNRINLKLPRFTLRFFLFSLFGLVTLVLVAEGVYYFKLTRQEIVRQEGGDDWKPSSILGEELALTPPQNKVQFGDLEPSMGVRELPNGTIGIAGYFSRMTADSLTLKVKGKEVIVIVDSTTIWRRIDIRGLNTEKGEKAPTEEISPDGIKEGDWIDVLCQRSEHGLKAIGVLVVYH